MNFKLFFRIILFLAIISFCSPRAVLAVGKIKKGKHVTINYALKVDGQIVQTTFGQKPFDFTVGAGMLLPAFEKQIDGLRAKDKKTFSLAPQDGYGELNPQAFREVPKSNFQEGMALQVGMVLQIPDANGQQRQGVIWKINEKSVVLNFNHPLAGKTLTFEIEVISVE